MSFPTDPRDIVAEMWIGSAWVDVSSHAYQRDAITINRGRPNESSDVQHSKCELTLNNRNGVYSPRNPLSAYYGQLGRNTPFRLALRTITDDFGTTVSNGWGTTDTGETWTTGGSGGSVQASDFQVAGGVATHSVPATLAHRRTVLDTGPSYRDVDVACTVTMPFSNVTGGDVEPCNIILRWQSSTDHYFARVVITAAEAVTVTFHHFSAGELASPVTVSGLTHTGQALRIRVQAEGGALRAKVWAAAGDEPYAWHATVHDTRITSAGKVGVRSGVAGTNTNTLPIVFSYDDFEVRVPRFAGEVTSFPPRWDTSGNDAYAPIQANGILRRLSQGSPTLKSTMYRAVTTLSPPARAYWPAEDANGATSVASALGGPAMVVNGSPTWATNNDFVASDSLPELNQSAWFGDVPSYTATGTIQLRFLLKIPAAGATNDTIIARMGVTGTATLWELVYYSGGSLGLKAYDVSGTNILTAGPIGFTIDGELHRISVELDQNGSDVDYRISTLEVGNTVGGTSAGTLVGYVIYQCLQVQINPQGVLDDVVVGHVSLQSEITSLFDLSDELKGYAGETAGNRLQRLCTEEGIPLYYTGDLDETALMGAQSIAKLRDLLNECARADLGTLHEARGTIGLHYRTRQHLYNQAAVATLDYSNNELAPPFEPTDDDQLTRNDVTASRTRGSSARAILETGRMSVLDPEDGGVGRYDATVTVNVSSDAQLFDVAGWLMHLGTVDEFRYPQINVDFANARVAADATLPSALLDLDIDDRLVVQNATAANIYGDISQLARGYRELLNPFTHKLVLHCSPESPYQVLVLDDAQCKLDSTDSTLASAATSADTRLFVAVAGSTKWTTAAGQMPIPITIGGEDISVTAISALSPTFVAAGTPATGDNASVTPGLPAGIGTGDLLLVFAAIRNSPNGQPTAPDGYVTLLDATNVKLFGKPASASESAPIVPFTGGVSGATTQAEMAAFRGVAPAVLNSSAQLNASAQNVAYPALTVPSDNAVVLYLGWKQDDWTSVATIAGATEIGEVSTTTGDDAGIVWDYVIQTTAADISSGSFTVTGGASAISRGAVVALNGNVQMFTVTRSQNGITKAHSSGADVRHTRRATLAL
jgi:hypothetical protein